MTVGSQVKQCLASVKNIEASLSGLAMRSKSREAQQTFHETMEVMHSIQEDLHNRVGELEREEEQYKGF